MSSRRVGALLLGALQLFSTACYAYVPVRTSPPAGAHLALDLTDAGRQALARALGPNITRVEGTLVTMQDSAWVIDATSVVQGSRMSLPVEGIRVTVQPSYATRVDERRLSRKRTWLTFGTAALVVVGLFLGTDFFGRSTPPEGPPDGGPDQYRW